MAKKKKQRAAASKIKKQYRKEQLEKEAAAALAKVNSQRQRYKQLIHQGNECLDREEWYESYAKYIGAVLVAPSVWERHRFNVFADALKIISDHDEEIYLEREDLQVLRHRFANNEAEPIIFRVQATIRLWMYEDGYDFAKQRHVAQMALELIYRSPPGDGRRLAKEGSGLSVEQQLSKYRNLMLSCLAGLMPSTREPFDFWGGNKCDWCGKASLAVPGGLLVCHRCHTNVYCRKECQFQDWHLGGHMKKCLKKGKIRVGDFMLLRDRFVTYREDGSGPDLVQTIQPIKSKPGFWVVAANGTTFSVSSDLLVRIRQELAQEYLARR